MGEGNIKDDGVNSSNNVGEDEEVNISSIIGNFSVRVNLNSTVEEFKLILARECEIPVQQQRLIYKGRVMKDVQTLKSFGLEDNPTVHLAFSRVVSNSEFSAEDFNAMTLSGDTRSNSGSNPLAALLGAQAGRNGTNTMTNSHAPNTNPLPNSWASAGKADTQQARFHDSDEFRSGSSLVSITKAYLDDGLPSDFLREIFILKKLKHERIVRLLDVKVEPPEATLIVECADGMDLHSMIYLGLKKSSIKKVLNQTISAVSYCHSMEVMLRDLKPHSILYDVLNNRVMLADFSSARTFDDNDVYRYSTEVGTLPYKAPELLLQLNNPYTCAIDIWCVGCIFAEMVTGNPLFSGTTDTLVLRNIIKILGVPNEIDWPGAKSACLKVCEIETLPSDPLPELASVVPDLEPAGLDLLSKMLCIVPDQRVTAEEALHHPYFNDLDDPI